MPLAASQSSQSKALTETQFYPRWKSRTRTSAELTETRERAWEYSSEASSYTVVSRAPSLPTWVVPTIMAFMELQELPENWNSYGARVINGELIKQAVFVLSQVMKAEYPSPSVVPLEDGGIQVEWHRKQRDLEIVFAADDAPRFYYTNRAIPDEKEGSAYDFARLMHLLSELP